MVFWVYLGVFEWIMGIFGDGLIVRRVEGDICFFEWFYLVGYSIIVVCFDFLLIFLWIFFLNFVL